MNLKDQMVLDSPTLRNEREFSEPLTYAGGTIQCLFDENWLAVDGDYSNTSTVLPTASIYKADAPNLTNGDVVTIKGTDYTVRDMQPDTGDTGDVLLVLSV